VSDAILVLNAGSSSLKFSEFRLSGNGNLAAGVHGSIDALDGRARFQVTGADGQIAGEHSWPDSRPPGHQGAIEFLFSWLRARADDANVMAVGHRVVHGGARYTAPVLIDRATLQDLESLTPLAPLHQPHKLLPIRIISDRRPDLAQVACFDTAFHRTQLPVAQAFALPRSITEHGIRRYGFHGLSYEYMTSALPDYDGRAARGRTIVLHLGAGASMCAMNAGRSVATTMGFSTLDGLPMGTRCGSLDPGVTLFLLKELRMDISAIEGLLYEGSGLLGVSGVSSDMREILASETPEACFAIELFVYRIGRELGSLTAALGGLDAIVFTAGIGEHAAPIREAVCTQAAWLGVKLDREANAANGPRISDSSSSVTVWVIPANEELMIARHTRSVVEGRSGPDPA
jgi:acetate kinase